MTGRRRRSLIFFVVGDRVQFGDTYGEIKSVGLRSVKVVAEETVLGPALAIRLTGKAYVLDVRYEKDFQTDVVLRVSEEFRRRNIQRPLVTLGGDTSASASRQEASREIMLTGSQIA